MTSVTHPNYVPRRFLGPVKADPQSPDYRNMEEKARGPAHISLWLLGGLLALAIVNARVGLPIGPFAGFLEKWSYNVVLLGSAAVVIVRGATSTRERGAWLVLGISMALWTLGNVYYTLFMWDLTEIPVPSVSDGFWVIFYPGAYIGLMMLLRGRLRHSDKSVWLDGIIGALAITTVALATIFPPILQNSGGGMLSAIVDLIYPVADIVLIVFAIVAATLTGWKAGSTFTHLCASLVVFAIVDCIYLIQVANNTWIPGNVFEAGWPLAMILLASAAWRPADREVDQNRRAIAALVIPTAFATISLSALVYDHFIRIPVAAIVTSGVAVLIVILRMTLAFRFNLRTIASTRLEADTDELSGLGNRRRLMNDLEELDQHESPRHALVLFDLDGFKNYNDTFGHPAGDALLARLGRRLERALPERASAYRMGGDEFCVLVELNGESAASVSATLAASLADKGEGFAVKASYGWAITPDEESATAEALRLADRRMYENKNEGRVPALHQTSKVLMQALKERDPILDTHVHDVAELARGVAARLGLPDQEIQQLGLAAELHDIGKVAIPDAILSKPAPLNEEEWEFMRQHTIVGQRILMAAPALEPVGTIVRSSHERWDGRGYPDGLAGHQIPLGSRIVFVCDAFDAMVTDRPYKAGMAQQEAVEELERNAGGQFDPAVVQAFVAEIHTRAATERATA
jgi:two-component system cell cycle response regulator